MKRNIIILIVLVTLSLACSLGELIDGGDDSVVESEPTPQNESLPQSEPPSGNKPLPKNEKRCGDHVCNGPENINNCPEDCSTGSRSNPEAPAPSESNAIISPPSWFAPDAACQMTETSVLSEGSQWAFDRKGNMTELLPDGKATCVLEIQVCGDTIFKQQVVESSESCPESLHFSYAPPTQVCCAKWDEAKQTGSPCNPLKDADCDGVENDADVYPLDFSLQ